MSKTKYLVVVHPPKPKSDQHPLVGQTSGSYTAPVPPSVQWITASSAQEAASIAKVSPGGHALVAAERSIDRFDRAKQAPLEKRMADGTPYPEAVPA